MQCELQAEMCGGRTHYMLFMIREWKLWPWNHKQGVHTGKVIDGVWCFQMRRRPGQKFEYITGENIGACYHATAQLKMACYQECEGFNWPESSNVRWVGYESFLVESDPHVKTREVQATFDGGRKRMANERGYSGTF